MTITRGQRVVNQWLKEKKWKLAPFQKETIAAYLAGKSGLLNAPTGSGKTYALFLPVLIAHINRMAEFKTVKRPHLKVLWVTPLRALTKDIRRNLQLACDEMQIPWIIGTRTGDTGAKEKAMQRKELPDVMLITPESLHLMLAQKNNEIFFKELEAVIVDEWHEILGTKRAVQTELALSYLRGIRPDLLTWGISATIGNIEEALKVITGPGFPEEKSVIVRSNIIKKVVVESVLPDDVEKMPWAGYLGINLLHKVMPIVYRSTSTLLFTNTRSQTEIWYRHIIENYPDLAGIIAVHHGSLDREVRNWVEDNLHLEKLKLVVCTSSLDLGVDFRPVETVIQVGSPKSVSRFLQRAGRSGHRPNATSKIYFVPTHALELIEAVSLREGVQKNVIEDRTPIVQAFDVLAQYMVTLAVGNGFKEQELYEEVKSTYCYQFLTRDEWQWLLAFITTGGPSLLAYDEFKKVEQEGDLYVVKDRRIAMRHRLSMGTIVSDASMRIQLLNGKYLGTVEEGFITWLKIGDTFSFNGMTLELVRVKEMSAYVTKTKDKKAKVPRWAGGRIPLSSQLSAFIRHRLNEVADHQPTEPEMIKLKPLLDLQKERSAIPHENELLIEQCVTDEGYHIFIYPFEGRLVHEGMAALIAYRIAQTRPVTFSMAMNDYGFELLSDELIDMQEILEEHDVFTPDNLLEDIQNSVNSIEIARRKFREIAAISGMVFQGYPGKFVKARHLQASSGLLFQVMSEYEENNLLIQQAYQEALDQQLEEVRLRRSLERIKYQKVIIKYIERPTPFAFPILVDRLREQMSTETLESRINKLLVQVEG
jgi:ATP-dependent Lhr-like helicase